MVKKIINDVEILVHYLHEAEEFLELRYEVNSDEEEIKFEGEAYTSDRILKKGLDQDEDFGKVVTEEKAIEISTRPLPDESLIGHLLPLSCGMSGVLSLNELNMYQKHLVNAHIVELAESP